MLIICDNFTNIFLRSKPNIHIYFIVIEEMGVSNDSHLLDVSKSAHLPRQGPVSNSTDNSHNTSCGNIVIVENSLHNTKRAFVDDSPV